MTVCLLSVDQLSYHAADRTLLDEVTFDLNFGQKICPSRSLWLWLIGVIASPIRFITFE